MDSNVNFDRERQHIHIPCCLTRKMKVSETTEVWSSPRGKRNPGWWWQENWCMTPQHLFFSSPYLPLTRRLPRREYLQVLLLLPVRECGGHAQDALRLSQKGVFKTWRRQHKHWPTNYFSSHLFCRRGGASGWQEPQVDTHSFIVARLECVGTCRYCSTTPSLASSGVRLPG